MSRDVLSLGSYPRYSAIASSAPSKGVGGYLIDIC